MTLSPEYYENKKEKLTIKKKLQVFVVSFVFVATNALIIYFIS